MTQDEQLERALELYDTLVTVTQQYQHVKDSLANADARLETADKHLDAIDHLRQTYKADRKADTMRQLERDTVLRDTETTVEVDELRLNEAAEKIGVPLDILRIALRKRGESRKAAQP